MTSGYKPIWRPDKPSYGGHRWFPFSPTLLREVAFPNQLHFERWIDLEWTPEIKAFCEQPLAISAWVDGVFVSTRFHFWIRLIDGTEHFEQVCYDNRPKRPTTDRAQRACTRWCEANRHNFEIVKLSKIRENGRLLANRRFILGFYDQRTYEQRLKIVHAAQPIILQIVAEHRPVRVHHLLKLARARCGQDDARLAFFDLLRNRTLITDLETKPFDGDSYIDFT
jgi:hypothetical protein